MLSWFAFLPLFSSCGSVGGGEVAPDPPTVVVSPQNPIVKTGAQQNFSATITNGSGPVVWAVTPNDGAHGSIDGNGVYSAPPLVPTPASVTVTATLPTSSGAPGMSVATIAKGTTTVAVSPPLSSVTFSQNLRLTATGVNTTNNSVTWSVDGIPSGNNSVGTISAQGIYVPTAAAAGTHIVTATSTDGSGAHGSATVAVSSYAGTFSWRNDTSISGVNAQEMVLSPATVNSTGFGKLFSCAVDGQIYAQPLYVANLPIGSGIHNVIFVATENDSLYAFDADANVSPCVPLWHDSFLPTGEEAVASTPGSPVLSTDITPSIGITGTPVIDSKANTLYVVSKSEQFQVNPIQYVQRLHAIDITTGAERPSSPAILAASVIGTGDGSNGTDTIAFDPLRENQRAGLLLLNGIVYIAFASHGEQGLYHGWVLAYDKTTLQQVGRFNDTPNAVPSQGGIWLGGAAPSVDPDTGYIYVATGNGAFDRTLSALGFPDQNDFGESVLKLDPKTLSVIDYFTPCNAPALTVSDQGMGSIGVVPLPDAAGSAAHPRLLLAGDKAGDLYLLDRTNLGHYTGGVAGGNCPDTAAVQEFDQSNNDQLPFALYGTPAFWTDSGGKIRIYVATNGSTMRAYPIRGASNPPLATAPETQTIATFGSQPPSPTISSNGATGGIVWVTDTSGISSSPPAPAVLRAYDATNLTSELYDSSQAANSRDTAGLPVKFSVPTIANGKVYVGTQSELDVYGLLP